MRATAHGKPSKAWSTAASRGPRATPLIKRVRSCGGFNLRSPTGSGVFVGICRPKGDKGECALAPFGPHEPLAVGLIAGNHSHGEYWAPADEDHAVPTAYFVVAG